MDNSLNRFLNAQEGSYEVALEELRNGKKQATGCGISFLS